MNGVRLYDSQKRAVEKLRTGSILCGGVGTGKSITSLAYFYTRVLGGKICDDGKLEPIRLPVNLYIITTARKRDTGEWEEECERFGLSVKPMLSIPGVDVAIDSWNNINKYVAIRNAFFIFDEQRVVGNGTWVRAFERIATYNQWILLSATPGDNWLDYIPVFVANGFYKNRSEFLRKHAIFSRYSKYPKVDRFIESGTLEYYRRRIIVNIEQEKRTIPHWTDVAVSYDKAMYKNVLVNRWDPFKKAPIEYISSVCYTLRRVANDDDSRISAIRQLMPKHDRMIVFYNFDYELERLKGLNKYRVVAEWNGHKHEEIPDSDQWLYLVQYSAGAEGWNCTETNAVVFYSQSYSYKTMTQAAGRIDRLNTPYDDLYFYVLRSTAPIDVMIARALKNKKSFNERAFLRKIERAGTAEVS